MFSEFLVSALIGLAIYFLLFSKGRLPKQWKKHGVLVIDSSVVASNFEIFLGKKSILHRDDYAYASMESAKFCGMLENPDPVILLKDLDLIKKVTIKDFDHFVDRRDFFPVSDDNSILRKLLGMLKGSEWRDVRTMVSPTFTSGKIKRMMEHFNLVGKEWTEMLQSQAKKNPSGSTTIDVLNTVNQYVVDVIGSAVFGMKTGTIQNPQARFALAARRLSEIGLLEFIKMNLGPRYPKLFKLLGIEALDKESIGFFETILRQGLEARKNGDVKLNDFQQLLIEAQRGELKAVGSDELSAFEKEAALGGTPANKHLTLTDDLIVAQSILFFLAGFTTTSNFISFSAYVLAGYPKIQEKLQKEVDGIANDDGTFFYDNVNSLCYLEMFVCEVMRHYPAAIRLERICTSPYKDPESGLALGKNEIVVIPINAIHHDPKYYPKPDEFNPENFNAENKASRSPYAFLPFGIGPRNCIGMRFALIESKTAIAHLVHQFLIQPTNKTPIPVHGVPLGVQWVTPKNLELKLTPRR